jgi:hypothetical protein
MLLHWTVSNSCNAVTLGLVLYRAQDPYMYLFSSWRSSLIYNYAFVVGWLDRF